MIQDSRYASGQAPPAGSSERIGPARGLSDRRRHPRVPLQFRASITIMDGPHAGQTHEALTRDLSLSGVCFLLPVALAVGYTCRMQIAGQAQVRTIEVMRQRQLSNGKYEIGAQYR